MVFLMFIAYLFIYFLFLCCKYRPFFPIFFYIIPTKICKILFFCKKPLFSSLFPSLPLPSHLIIYRQSGGIFSKYLLLGEEYRGNVGGNVAVPSFVNFAPPNSLVQFFYITFAHKINESNHV